MFKQKKKKKIVLTSSFKGTLCTYMGTILNYTNRKKNQEN